MNREFDVGAPDQVDAGDTTYLWTQEGWLYLAVVIDLYSRKMVGWSMSSRRKAQLVCDALRRAIWQRRPAAGLIVHSDRVPNTPARITNDANDWAEETMGNTRYSLEPFLRVINLSSG